MVPDPHLENPQPENPKRREFLHFSPPKPVSLVLGRLPIPHGAPNGNELSSEVQLLERTMTEAKPEEFRMSKFLSFYKAYWET